VADAVDDAGGGDRDPEHLDRPDRGTDGAEQEQVGDQHQADALPAVARVEIALDPVVGCAVAELGERLLVLGFGAIELAAGQENGLDAARLRAVGILFGLALGVVLAVDRDPLLGHHAGAEPEPETEEMRGDAVQVERPVRLRTVQEDRDGSDRDVGRDERVGNDLPAAEAGKAMTEPLHQRVENRNQHVHPLPLSTCI
jgi:hypothetical protein